MQQPDCGHVLIAIERPQGVARMQFGVSRRRSDLDDQIAHKANFTLSEDGRTWVREPSDENIAGEIARTFNDASRWWRVQDPSEFPERPVPPPKQDATPATIMVTESGEEVATQDPEARAEINRLQGIVAQLAGALDSLQSAMGDEIKKHKWLTDLQFETVAAEPDESPTVAKYPKLASVLQMDESQDGNAEAWQAAIQAYKEGQ